MIKIGSGLHVFSIDTMKNSCKLCADVFLSSSFDLELGFSFYAVNKWLATLISRATEKMMKQKDER